MRIQKKAKELPIAFKSILEGAKVSKRVHFLSAIFCLVLDKKRSLQLA